MRNKRIKIIATLGPLSSTPEMLLKLAEEGVDVFRINLSHQKTEEIQEIVRRIRETEKKVGRSLAIMGDLAGLKIRIGKVEDNTILKNGDEIKIYDKAVQGNKEMISVNHPAILKQLKKGAEIYVDDGLLRLVVQEEEKEGVVVAKVVIGGKLKSFKGFFAQGVTILSDGLTAKDREDIQRMVDANVDALAVSFVQTAKDIKLVRDMLPKNSEIFLVAKVETQLAMENIEEIIQEADAIMVARGDLGLSVPISEVPLMQKKLISLCLKHVKPVITATQMLESMTHNPFPTRAEVADVANAILDGTDAVMLSGETAVGEYPAHVIEMMSRIIRTTSPHIVVREFNDEDATQNAVSAAVGTIADKVNAKLVIAFTHSGITAQRLARYRHAEQTIIAFTPDPKTLHKLNFCWGVYPKFIEETKDFDHALNQAKQFVLNNDIIQLQKGDPYIVVAGVPFGQSGSTNLIYVERA